MKLEQLRVFVAVAEREHVTQAATAMHLTQSAVSHVLSQLERDCGLALFSRVGRRIELTEAGRVLLSEAQALLQRAELTKQRLQALAGLVRGELKLHASHTVAAYWLPSRLSAFQQQHAGLRLQLNIHNTQQVCQLLCQGEAGLGLVEGEVAEAELDSIPVAEDQMWLVVSPGHPWRMHPPSPAELCHSDWILREPGSGTRTVCEQLWRAQGLALTQFSITMELASNEAVAAAVAAGMAATILSARVVSARAADLGLQHVPWRLPPRQFKLVWHRQRELSPAQQAFTRYLRGAET